MANAPIPKFVDNPTAPELFAAAATGFFAANGTITITFEAVRADHSDNPGSLSRVVVGRVVMPVPGAQGLAIGLFDFLQKQGVAFEKAAEQPGRN
jgi:hypothetical protein